MADIEGNSGLGLVAGNPSLGKMADEVLGKAECLDSDHMLQRAPLFPPSVGQGPSPSLVYLGLDNQT